MPPSVVEAGAHERSPGGTHIGSTGSENPLRTICRSIS
jgi:hypothetical protein